MFTHIDDACRHAIRYGADIYYYAFLIDAIFAYGIAEFIYTLARCRLRFADSRIVCRCALRLYALDGVCCIDYFSCRLWLMPLLSCHARCRAMPYYAMP